MKCGGCITPEEAKLKIESQKNLSLIESANLEEQAISLVGKDIYEILIKGYTQKQWKTNPKKLPAFIIKRLPLRFTYNNNYFNDFYQGIPINGYDKLFENMLNGIEVKLNVNYFNDKDYFDSLANKIVFTGKIDEFYGYKFGELEYRTLDFEHEIKNIDNYQGNAVINYTDIEIPWTRIIEHKHFNNDKSDISIITKEIPSNWNKNKIPYYPINDDSNNSIYRKYKHLSEQESKYIFGGRLSEYKYYDMHQVIASAMSKFNKMN